MACQKGHLDIVNALLNHKSIEINKARTDNGGANFFNGMSKRFT